MKRLEPVLTDAVCWASDKMRRRPNDIYVCPRSNSREVERLLDIIVRAKRIAETEQASMTLQVLDEA